MKTYQVTVIEERRVEVAYEIEAHNKVDASENCMLGTVLYEHPLDCPNWEVESIEELPPE